VGACFEVYPEKGNGFLEAVYQECLEKEFKLRGLDNKEKPRLQIINYLKATGLRLGLLVKFGHYPKIENERFVL